MLGSDARLGRSASGNALGVTTGADRRSASEGGVRQIENARWPTFWLERLVDTFRYVVISAVRNEAPYIEKTLDSVMAQTVLPTRSIIVDDGASDGTS